MPVTQDTVTRIAKNDVAVFNEMTNLTTANGWLERTSYSEITGVIRWGKTINWNDTARVKEVEFLDTTGFALIIVDENETTIDKSYILLESNTNNPNYLSSPLIYQNPEDVNRLYGAMSNEIIVAFDAFLETLGNYKEIDFITYIGKTPTSRGSTSAVTNFKQIIRDMCTFPPRKNGGTSNIPVFYGIGKLIVTTENYEYTFTAQSYLDHKTQKTQLMKLTIEIERIS